MNNTLKSGVILSTILVALAAYYFIWVYVPGGDVRIDGLGIEEVSGDNQPSENSTDNSGNTPVDYLSTAPVIPESRAVAVNEMAPDFSYYSIDGREVRLSDYIGNKNVILDFWATWCGPCMMELPALEEFYKTNSDRFEVIAVSSEARNSANSIASVVNQKGLTFPVIHDPSGGIGNLYPTRSIPYLVLINMDGTVRKMQIGYSPTVGEEILEEFGLNQNESESTVTDQGV
ncbi:MAG: TlpA disulfide reductase family protein [bacterium]|nr:TlpA disulfide reductase family protein [bacterium]